MSNELLQKVENPYWTTQLSLPSSIPSKMTFVGRENELEELSEAYSKGARIFVLSGLGGIGKTAIALIFIETIREDFHAFVMVNLRSSGLEVSTSEIMYEIVRQFNPEIRSGLEERELFSIYISLLNRHKTVVFLDDVLNREQVESLLVTRDSLFILTSRRHLAIFDGFNIEIKPLSEAEAVNFLLSSVGESRLKGKANELVRLCGYVPLAIKILASVLKNNRLIKIEDLIDDFAHKIDSIKANKISPSFKETIEISYDLLDKNLKSYWRKLAVFLSDFEIQAVKKIWQTDNAEEYLTKLVDFSLIGYDRETLRFQMHPLLKDYAREKLSTLESFEINKLHATFYGELIRNLTTITPENIRIFDSERNNIEQGFKWVRENIEKESDIASLGIYYTVYPAELLRIKLHRREFIKWIQLGLIASRQIKYRPAEASQLLNLAIVYSDLGEYRKAINFAEESLTFSREVGDKQNETFALSILGNANWSLGDYKKAIDFYEQALQISREIGDLQGEGNSLGNLGNAYLNLGNYKKAIEFYEQALEISREIGDLYGKGNRLGNLGIAYSSLGEYRKAIDYHKQALEISREIGDLYGESNQLGNLGVAYLRLGEYKKANDYYEQALQISREIGNRQGEGNQLGNLGIAYSSLGEYKKAIDYYEQALQISKEIGDRQGEGSILGNLGLAYLRLGEYKKAIDYHEQALQISKEIGDRQGEGIWLGNLGLAYNNLGEHKKAIDYHEQALQISREIGDRQGEGSWLGNLGDTYKSLGEKEKSCGLWKEALAIFEAIESPNANVVRQWIEEYCN